MSSPSPILDNRAERILAFMVGSSIILSIVCFVAVIIATAAGLRDFGQGIWPIVIVLPAVGLPLGALTLIALLIVRGVRRARESKDARR